MWYQIKDNDCYVAIKVKPNAKKSRITGIISFASSETHYGLDEALQIDIAAHAADNKANNAIIKFLAKTLGLPIQSFSIKTGKTSRIKIISIENAAPLITNIHSLTFTR